MNKPHAAAVEKLVDEARPASRLGDVLTLAKVRLNALVVATTAGGYYMGSVVTPRPAALLIACLGTALVASGAAAINQVWEQRTDRLMNRTRHRPVASGRMSSREGLAIGLVLSVVGLGVLQASANTTATLVALVTLLSYVLVYTPLKLRTSLSTVVGAVPGALPPLIGWAAASHSVTGIAPWSLFIVSFLWQLPHFLAISWMYREDYGRAGLRMLSVIDRDGSVTGRQAALWATSLIPASQLPYLVGLTGPVYAIGALVLGIGQLLLAFRFARHRSVANARGLFFASIIYLPLLWLLMVAGKQ